MLESVDTLLQILAGQRADELRLETGQRARLFSSGSSVDMSPQPLTQQDVLGALRQIVPEHVRRLLPTQPVIDFDYECYGAGTFGVSVARTDNRFVVSFLPRQQSAAPPRDAGRAPAPTPPPPAPPQPSAPPPSPARAAATPARTGGEAAMNKLFYSMVAAKASDLHLSASATPLVRKDGEMVPLDPSVAPLSADDVKRLLAEIMPEKNRAEFEARHDTDFAYEIPGLARFRANIFFDRKGMGGVFRVIPNEILTAEDLAISPAVLKLCQLKKGLVLVTGPTGSGKSTTLCALIDYINRNRLDHIITIEDPIEFVHENKQCLINQREVHNHTDSFKDALRAALREDPDIVLVGEMRDLETIAIAIETAETGHLVFGTLHTSTAASTVDRIIDQFPADRQSQIRVMLSESLRGVIAQTLCKKVGGGRVAALEVLIANTAIANLIREGKTFQIPSMMQTGRGMGMVTLNDALMDLVKKNLVVPEEAYNKASDKVGFETLLKRGNVDTKFIATT